MSSPSQPRLQAPVDEPPDNSTSCQRQLGKPPSELTNALSMDHLKDFTITCNDGKRVFAHKVILSLKSQYFKGIFEADPMVFDMTITNFNSETIRSMINYLYTGQLPVDSKVDTQLLAAIKICGILHQPVPRNTPLKKDQLLKQIKPDCYNFLMKKH